MASKDPLPSNIASEAIQAYYSGIDVQTVNTWACQVLCMIAKYHMACVTRGAPVTSPILPGVIEDKLPPLAGYAPPENRLGVTDIRVRDHWTKTLRVAIWIHRLDMALSREPATSGSLVWARHSLGCLLAYFLAPWTAWGLRFKDVVGQVLLENRKHNERRWNEASSSLRKCLSRRTKLHDELDAVNKTLEVAPVGQTCLEMEQRLAAIHTSLTAIENSIAKFKNLIEECRMLEEEARQMEEEEASQDQSGPREEAADIEMVDQEELGNPESSSPQMEVNTEDNHLPASDGDAISQEEENVLLGEICPLEDSSPRSKTAVVSGGMAELRFTSPAHPGTEEGETS